jgi:hypothetical protein
MCPCRGSSGSHRRLTAEEPSVKPGAVRERCDGHRGPGTGFSPTALVFSVSLIPPMLHTLQFIYYRHYMTYQLRVSLNNTQNTWQTCPYNLTVLRLITLSLLPRREIQYVFKKYVMSSCQVRKILVSAFVSSIFITIISQI